MYVCIFITWLCVGDVPNPVQGKSNIEWYHFTMVKLGKLHFKYFCYLKQIKSCKDIGQ